VDISTYQYLDGEKSIRLKCPPTGGGLKVSRVGGKGSLKTSTFGGIGQGGGKGRGGIYKKGYGVCHYKKRVKKLC